MYTIKVFSSNTLKWNLPLQWALLSLILRFSCKSFRHSAIWKTWQLSRVIPLNWSYSVTSFSRWYLCPMIVLHCLPDPYCTIILSSLTIILQLIFRGTHTTTFLQFSVLPLFIFHFSWVQLPTFTTSLPPGIDFYELPHHTRLELPSTGKLCVSYGYFSAYYDISYS